MVESIKISELPSRFELFQGKQGKSGSVGPPGPAGSAGPPMSVPPQGKCKVTNLYVDPDTGKLVVEYSDIPTP